MVFAVAGERTIAVKKSGAVVLKQSARCRWRDESRIEIDEMRRVGNPVGIMAGCASGLVVHDVLAVKRETLIGQNTRAAVAFIAERVLLRTFRLKILRAQIAFEQRRKNRTVRAVRTGAAGSGTGVAVM